MVAVGKTIRFWSGERIEREGERREERANFNGGGGLKMF